MGKTRHLFKKIRDTKGTFHAKMGLIKDRNIKKRWQEHTEELYKNLHHQDIHDGVITHLESDIRNAKSSWPYQASLRTKLVKVMEFQ